MKVIFKWTSIMVIVMIGVFGLKVMNTKSFPVYLFGCVTGLIVTIPAINFYSKLFDKYFKK